MTPSSTRSPSGGTSASTSNVGRVLRAKKLRLAAFGTHSFRTSPSTDIERNDCVPSVGHVRSWYAPSRRHGSAEYLVALLRSGCVSCGTGVQAGALPWAWFSRRRISQTSLAEAQLEQPTAARPRRQAFLRRKVEQLVQTIALGLLLGGILALAASGLTLIFGVMGVVNVAHGAFLILAAFLTWTTWRQFDLDPLLTVLLTTPVMFALGLALYVTTLRRIRGSSQSMTVILTFAIAIVIEGVMGFVWGNTSHAVTPTYFTRSFRLGGLFFPKADVFGALLAVALLTILYIFLTRTWLGRAIRAASENPQAAKLVGINIAMVAALTFAIGAATTGAGGSIISVLFPFAPGSHVQWISRLLGVIVLGGMGSLPGAVIGALLLGTAESLASVYISIRWATAVPFIVIFVALLLRPQGIMGVRLREDVA